MKKVLLLITVLSLGLGLSACKKTTTPDPDPDPVTCTAPQVLVNGVCTTPTVDPGEDPEYDVEGTYITYFSGVDNMNPYSETLADSSTMYTFLTDGLYYGDYDWAKAIAEGLATEVGDFTTSGAAVLPFNRLPAMAAADPVDINGDGTVWQITLRQDLEFEDGTPIDANTFEYSWQMLLDPLLLNDRATNLYDSSNLPLVAAEAYFKQKTSDKDGLGFLKYEVDGVMYTRENSYSTTATGHPDWLLYLVETGPYSGITGPDGKLLYVEYWGTGYGFEGYVFVDIDDEAFEFDSEGTLIAPYAGWTYADGSPVATADQAVGATDYAGALPAYMDENQNRAIVDEDGIPVGGVETSYDATPVTWEEVGFKVISQYVFEITLKEGRTAWDVKGNLMSGITGVVHPANFEAGMNDGRTQTTYGTIDNPLVSYGVYNLTTWEDGQLFIFTRNDNHYQADMYRIKHIRYEVIADQSIAVDEFKAGRLDVVNVSGDYFTEFKYSPYLRLSPVTTFFRFAFNISGSVEADANGEKAYELNPILVYPEFRRAFYFAIDREEFASEVRAPSHPTYGFLGPVYLSTEYGSVAYRASDAGVAVLADLYPETYGFNPTEAKALFDQAYAQAITDGLIVAGDIVTVEYKFYDVETNWKVANWVKSTVEAIFNQGSNKPKFNLALAAVSSSALSQAWDNGDFEMTFGGWQGLNFDAPSMLGQVYNSDMAYMLEVGFDTANAEVTVNLASTKAALTSWVANYETLTTTTATQDEQYDLWVDLLALFVGDELTTTYTELYSYAYSELYNVQDINYEGKVDDFNAITAALEGVLLDQMIAIPLFTSVTSAVYSSRVVFEANEYHAWMAWGGFQYMYLLPAN